MIVETLMEGVYFILDNLFFFEIPNLPPEVYDYVSQMFDYLTLGAGILANYTPLAYMIALFAILLVVDAAVIVYHLVMWVIKKIPLLGME